MSDNEYPTYAVTKKELKDSGVKTARQVRMSEEIGCIVLELGYFIERNTGSIECNVIHDKRRTRR